MFESVRSILAGVFAALTLFSMSALADTPLPPTIKAALKAAAIPEASYAALVMTLDGQVLLARNAEVAMNPASVMKVVTTFAGLETLGPAYTWRTEVYATGPVVGGRLQGNLVIKGGGDPMLSMEKFWMLLRDVRARGIRDIAGDVLLDRAYFAEPDIDPGLFDGRPTRPYNAGPDALLVNFRSVRLTFVPDAETRSVRILAEPPLPEFGIVNRLEWADAPCDGWPEDAVADMTKLTLTFEGRYPASCGEQVKFFTLLPPNDYNRALFDHLWRGLGGTVTGTVRVGSTDAAAKFVTSLESGPLLEAMREINKHSNNVMARHLFLTLGRAASGTGSLESARAAVAASLQRAGITAPELYVENGAGLSRNARVSAMTLARILSTAASLPVGPEFISSFPIAGVDGTLRRWFNKAAFAGRAHLKTGYLENVRAMAGYVHGPDGRMLVAVGLVNHPNARNAMGVQEALIQWAYEAGGRPGCCFGMQRAARKGQSAGGRPRP